LGIGYHHECAGINTLVHIVIWKLEGRDRVVPAFKPPYDIINRIAQDARGTTEGTKKQAASYETTCPVRLPRQDSNLRPKD